MSFVLSTKIREKNKQLDFLYRSSEEDFDKIMQDKIAFDISPYDAHQGEHLRKSLVKNLLVV